MKGAKPPHARVKRNKEKKNKQSGARPWCLNLQISEMMKKSLFLVFISSMFLVGCTSVNNGATIQTISVVVEAHEWKYTNFTDNNYFYAGFDIPAITENVFDRGEVKAYIVYDRLDMDYARKNLLPHTIHKEEWIDTLRYVYTETVDFTYGIGWVEFNFRASDFAYEDNVSIIPPAMEFDIVITKP